MDLSVTQSKLTERQKELSTLGKERSQLNSSLFSLKQRFDELLKENIRRSECSHVTVAMLASCVGQPGHWLVILCSSAVAFPKHPHHDHLKLQLLAGIFQNL